MLNAASETSKDQKLIMEWRTCPCGKSFRCLSSSPQIYHTSYCKEQDAGKTVKPIKDKSKPTEVLDMAPAPMVEPTPAPAPAQALPPSPEPEVSPIVAEECERSEWAYSVNKAKGLIHSINKARFDIATLALKVCVIRQGGKQGDKYKTGRSLKDFAKEIGICHKTLCEWVRIKRNIIDKLPEGLYMPDKYAAAQRAACKVTRKAKPEVVVKAYKRELNDTSPQFYFDQLVRRARLEANYLENNSLKGLSRESIEELLEYNKRSLKVLKSHLES